MIDNGHFCLIPGIVRRTVKYLATNTNPHGITELEELLFVYSAIQHVDWEFGHVGWACPLDSTSEECHQCWSQWVKKPRASILLHSTRRRIHGQAFRNRTAGLTGGKPQRSLLLCGTFTWETHSAIQPHKEVTDQVAFYNSKWRLSFFFFFFTSFFNWIWKGQVRESIFE